MAVTRINNNQISDASTGNAFVGINAAVKLQDYSVTATKIANNLTYGSDLTITGNLTIQGNTTAIDTTFTTIEDPVILLASTQTGSPSVDIGFIGERGTSNNIAFVWDESATEFVTAFTSSAETNTTITISGYASLKTLNTAVTGNLSTAGFATVTGNITGGNVISNAQVVATSNITGSNLNTAGQVIATGNITGGNLITAGQTISTGNITGGNIITAGLGSFGTTVNATGNITGGNVTSNAQVTATGNITGGNLITAGLASVTGNITGGNIVTGGQVVATGNITGGNLSAGAGLITTTGNVNAGNINISGSQTISGNINAGNLNAVNRVSAATGFFTGNVDVLGNLNATVGIVYANSGIFYGNSVTGNNAAFAGVPGFTQLGSNVVMQFAGNVNSYSQINFENINSGNRASTDYIATADNGNDTSNYVNMGIASSTYNFPDFGGYGPNDAYLHNDGGNLILNPETAGRVIKFMVGGTGNANVMGTMSSTALSITGIITATGNIVGANVNSNAQIVATGNITGGNLITAGLGSFGTTVNATGNITGGNIITAGAVNAATLNTTGNAVIAGNLFVLGNLTYNNVEDLRVEDPVIIVGTGPNGAPLTGPDSFDRGIFMEYFKASLGNAWMGWQNSSGNMIAASRVAFSANNIISVTEFGTFQTGNIYAQSAVAVGNVTGGNLITAGLASITGNVTGGNLNTAGQVVATGNVAGGNLNTAGQVVATGNITGGNINTTGSFSSASLNVTGNITGGNLNTAGQVVATGNVRGGNIVTAGLGSFGTTVNATGNITGGNLITAGLASVTGNVTGGNIVTAGQVVATGNVTGGNIVTAGLGSFGTTVNATGNITGGNLITAGQTVTTGNITGGNINTGAQVVATGNITGGNIVTAGLGSFGTTVTATGNITGGNLITAGQTVTTGNITGGNINTGAQVVATGNITGGNIVTAGSGTFGNIVISGSNVNSNAGRITMNSNDVDVDFAVDGDTVANVFYVDAGTGTASFGSSTQTTNAVLALNSTNSVLIPVGTTGQRPDPGTLGMLRFNSTLDAVEVYTSADWTPVGTPEFTVITDQQFNGNGVGVAYTLANASTTNSAIVSINGVLQLPTVAYSVSGTTLTFTEAPQTGDIIDVRVLTTTTEIVGISNSPGTAVIQPNATLAQVDVTGNLIPTADVTYNLGSPTARWNELFLAGNTITLGNTVIKNTGGNTIGFFGPNGTTPATIDPQSVDTTTIANGTSSVSVLTSGGNIRANVGGATVVSITGTGANITGELNASGNVSGGNLNVTGNLVDSGPMEIITGTNGNIALSPNGSGVIVVNKDIRNGQANGVGNIGASGASFNTIFARATSAQYADLAENYAADAKYAPGTVLSFGGEHEVTVSTVESDRRIAGVVSTNPSYIMNSVLEATHVATVALTGRVPTLVSGPVSKGDMMVSDGNGRAIACATPAMGTVIGKALENHPGGHGTIEVVVGRL